jgi:hypothetical protein
MLDLYFYSPSTIRIPANKTNKSRANLITSPFLFPLTQEAGMSHILQHYAPCLDQSLSAVIRRAGIVCSLFPAQSVCVCQNSKPKKKGSLRPPVGPFTQSSIPRNSHNPSDLGTLFISRCKNTKVS